MSSASTVRDAVRLRGGRAFRPHHWLLMLFTAASSLSNAASYEPFRIDSGATQGTLWTKEPAGRPNGVVVVIPGAQMVAERYMWLTEALVADGYATVLIEAAQQWIAMPSTAARSVPVRYVTIPHALLAVDHARNRWPEASARSLVGIGHSLGAAVLLELLDPAEAARNPNTQAPAGFEGVPGLDLAVVLGTSLQSTTRSMTLPYRSDTRALSKPARTRLLFVAASQDAMAPPVLMRKTASRYSPPPDVQVIDGGNHLGWSPGRGPMDRNDLDGSAAITQDEQISVTLKIIRAALQQGARR